MYTLAQHALPCNIIFPCRIREIRPQHLIWSESEPEKKPAKQQQHTKPASTSSVNSSSTAAASTSKQTPPTAGAAAKNEPNDEKGDAFVAFLLGLRGDYFSAELEEIVNVLAPAFPSVWFVRAEGPEFSKFTSQYAVRSFPTLLLFNSGKYHTR
jgi:hypothetical protein